MRRETLCCVVLLFSLCSYVCMLYVHLSVIACVSVCASVTETLPLSRWPLRLRKHILNWSTDLTDILCVPHITWLCLCVWCPDGAVYSNTGFFWTEVDWLHPTQDSVSVHLCVIIIIALVLHISQINPETHIRLSALSSLTSTGVELL